MESKLNSIAKNQDNEENDKPKVPIKQNEVNVNRFPLALDQHDLLMSTTVTPSSLDTPSHVPVSVSGAASINSSLSLMGRVIMNEIKENREIHYNQYMHMSNDNINESTHDHAPDPQRRSIALPEMVSPIGEQTRDHDFPSSAEGAGLSDSNNPSTDEIEPKEPSSHHTHSYGHKQTLEIEHDCTFYHNEDEHENDMYGYQLPVFATTQSDIEQQITNRNMMNMNANMSIKSNNQHAMQSVYDCQTLGSV